MRRPPKFLKETVDSAFNIYIYIYIYILQDPYKACTCHSVLTTFPKQYKMVYVVGPAKTKGNDVTMQAHALTVITVFNHTISLRSDP